MKDCWEILGIPSGSEEEDIKSRFRELVKQWHPDKVQSPEKKRRYTIRCAEINGAYKEALSRLQRQAKAGVATAATRAPWTQEAATVEPRVPWTERAIEWAGVVIGLTLMMAVVTLATLGPPALVARLGDSHPISIALHLAVSVLGGLLLAVALTALPDMFAYLVTMSLWERLGLDQYAEKLSWLAILVLNFLIMFVWPFATIGEGATISEAYMLLTRATAALIIPLALFASWVSDILRARKARVGAREALIVVSQ